MEETSEPIEGPEEIVTDTLESEVKVFAESLPYWAKYIADKILLNSAISEDEVEMAYSYFLEEAGVAEKTEKPEILIVCDKPSIGAYKTDLQLTHVQNLEGVNALVEGQSIKFGPHLTVVYGENGAGKSGYARLLKKAFYSKAPEDILPNVYIDPATHKPINAEFLFESGGGSYSLSYPADFGNSEFRQFAIFDGKGVLRQLEGRNEFEFRPAGLSFFADFTQAITRVEEYLTEDLTSKRIPNTFPLLFEGASVINTFLNTLSKDSDITELKKHVPYSEADREAKKQCQASYDSLFVDLNSSSTRVAEISNLIRILKSTKEVIIVLNTYFVDSYLTNIGSFIKDCTEKELKAKDEGIESFSSEQIQGIGGPEWKSFIEAAETFAKRQKNSEGAEPSLEQEEARIVDYPSDEDSCLFCHQPLTPEATELITKYWAFIRSQAEQDARLANTLLDRVKESYEKLRFDLFPEDSVLTPFMTGMHLETLNNLVIGLNSQKELSSKIISDITSKTECKYISTQVDTVVIDTIITSLEESLESYNDDAKVTRLGELADQLRYYGHKEKLELHIDNIEAYINNLKWASSASEFSWIGLKQNTTRAEKQLSGKYFNDRYIEIFNKECEILNGSFMIDIDPKSAGAKTNRQLFIKGRSPSAILSEGEQKIIAIADFLAEMQLTDVNRGIIFDDPVTSLDNTRKGEIAERFADESMRKQVIIFTHDLVFVSKILTHCEDTSVPSSCHWVESLEGIPGYVWLDNSPSHEKEFRNSKKPKEFYDSARVTGCPPAEREQLIKSGFTALRTCYEVLVINGLFNSAVQRWNERVSLDRLTGVKFDQAIVDDLMDSYAQCCRYMEGHSHSDKYSYKKPDVADLNDEIVRYEAIRKKINDSKPKI